DLVGSTQFTALPLELLDPLSLCRRVGRGRSPRARSAGRTQLRGVSPEQPIFSAIDWMTAHCDASSQSCSNTGRTARSRTSGSYLFVLLVTLLSQERFASGKPAAVRRRLSSEHR